MISPFPSASPVFRLGKAGEDQLLGEIDGRRDEQKGAQPLRLAQRRKTAREEESDPGPHRAADHDLWAFGRSPKKREALLQPVADRPVLETTARNVKCGFPVTRIVEFSMARPLAAARASRKPAFEPRMSEAKPPSQT